jgi:hypothetical protein
MDIDLLFNHALCTCGMHAIYRDHMESVFRRNGFDFIEEGDMHSSKHRRKGSTASESQQQQQAQQESQNGADGGEVVDVPGGTGGAGGLLLSAVPYSK